MPAWDAIDWFRSTSELNRQVAATLADRSLEMPLAIGYRRLGPATIVFLAEREPTAVGDPPPAADAVGQLARGVFAAHRWLVPRERGGRA